MGFEPISANGHTWPTWGNWYCDAHHQVCDPWKPVTAADLLERAAKDESLADDTFAVLSRTLRGDDPADQSGDL